MIVNFYITGEALIRFNSYPSCYGLSVSPWRGIVKNGVQETSIFLTSIMKTFFASCLVDLYIYIRAEHSFGSLVVSPNGTELNDYCSCVFAALSTFIQTGHITLRLRRNFPCARTLQVLCSKSASSPISFSNFLVSSVVSTLIRDKRGFWCDYNGGTFLKMKPQKVTCHVHHLFTDPRAITSAIPSYFMLSYYCTRELQWALRPVRKLLSSWGRRSLLWQG